MAKQEVGNPRCTTSTCVLHCS